MSTTMSPRFDDADALDQLCRADPAALDTLDYGVIGFGLDAEAVVQRYNRTESVGSGLALAEVMGRPLVFPELARAYPAFVDNQRLLFQRRKAALGAERWLAAKGLVQSRQAAAGE